MARTIEHDTHTACGLPAHWHGPKARAPHWRHTWRIMDGTARQCEDGATGGEHTCAATERIDADPQGADVAAIQNADGEREQSEQTDAPIPAEIAALARPALRSRYIATFPADKRRAQYLSNDAMRQALANGRPAPATDGATAPNAAGGSGDALVAAIAEIAARVTPQTAPLDEERVREIAREESRPVIAGLSVRTETAEIGRIEGAFHRDMPKVASALAAGCHVFMVGPAGSGKTTLARQAARSLGYADDLYLAPSIGPDTRAARLVGFRSPTTGEIVRGVLRDLAERGGCALLDEMDTAHPSVLPEINALLANGHYLFPDGEVTIHPRFRVMAGANTYGRGADAVYVGRSPIDGASLDRFVVIEIAYDPDLERAMIGLPRTGPAPRTYTAREVTTAEREDWYRRVAAIRAAAVSAKVRMIVSPRATLNGVRLMGAGWSREEIEDSVIWRGISADDRSRVQAGVRA